ncbi:head fiber protein [Bacillus gobiensis]|uniref:Head fiber protein n=1 Tax=Bacillus gobiensis TaxID=1441095 RepID=A0A0M4FRN2_9BACI|nr:head fiber protein [Bacillus gobiensis]ALC80443.1 hypothetical protein AM592_01725 [Bacillus gobiensis]
MSDRSTKNYRKPDKWVVEGELSINGSGKITKDGQEIKLGGAVSWEDVQGKPSAFTPSSHTHNISDITSLQTTLNGKLSASKAATQADSTATDAAGLKNDFNNLLAKLKAAGIMN